ncbi:MAG: hypothetical protein COB24_11955 [Hyphomicrobiales bacterium]|nr:MAG: hypothetical protein COB24_11955 [Hyphomicrobiales bacterium]
MPKDFSPTHIVITALANRGRNAIRFVKNVAQTLKLSDFTLDQLQAFEKDPKLTHAYIVDEELVAVEQKAAEEHAKQVAEIAGNKDALDAAAALKLKNRAALIAALKDYPEADLTKAGKPDLSKLGKKLGFKIDRKQLEVAQAEMAKSNAK